MNLCENNENGETRDSKSHRTAFKKSALVRILTGCTFNEKTNQWELQYNGDGLGTYNLRCSEKLMDVLTGKGCVEKYIKGKLCSRLYYSDDKKVTLEEVFNELADSENGEPILMWRTSYHENGIVKQRDEYTKSGNLQSRYCYNEKGKLLYKSTGELVEEDVFNR